MKLNTSNFFIEISFLITQIILACCVGYVFSRYTVNVYYFQWAAVGLCVLLLLREGLKKSSIAVVKPQQWLPIMGLQLALFATFYGISNYFGQHVFSQAITYTSFSLGFAPWAVMILIAIILRLTLQRTAKDVFFVDAMGTLFTIKSGGRLWTLIHLSVRQCTNVILAVTLALLSLNVVNALTGPFIPFSASSVLISFIVILFALLKKPQQLFKKLVTNREKLHLTLPLLAIASAVIIALLALLFSGIAHTHTHTPALMTYLNASFNPAKITQLFSQSWWLAWAVAGGVFIAHQSRHMGLRQMILISAVLPLLMSACMMSTRVSSALTTHSWSVIVGILGVIGLCKLLFQANTLPTTIISYLPATAQPKQRAHQFHMLKLIKCFLVVLFFTLPIGAQVPTFFSSVVTLPIIEISLVLFIVSLALSLMRKR